MISFSKPCCVTRVIGTLLHLLRIAMIATGTRQEALEVRQKLKVLDTFVRTYTV